LGFFKIVEIAETVQGSRFVMARLEIEHILPASRGGASIEENLWLSSPLCNGFKSDHTSAADPTTGVEVDLFNPRRQRWNEHFVWSPDGLRVIGLTPTGRATVALLRLDSDPDAILVRSYWVQAGWHPPSGDEERIRHPGRMMCLASGFSRFLKTDGTDGKGAMRPRADDTEQSRNRLGL
jgi:hypothetical protein